MADSDNAEQLCSLCGKKVSVQSFLVHQVHCERNFYRCVTCGATMSKSQKDAHEATAHALATCPSCGHSAPAFQLPSHKCRRPPQVCTFCNAQIAYEDIVDHSRECGSRTERCSVCSRFIQKWELEKHQATCTGVVEEPPVKKGNRFLDGKGRAEEGKAGRIPATKPGRTTGAKPGAVKPGSHRPVPKPSEARTNPSAKGALQKQTNGQKPDLDKALAESMGQYADDDEALNDAIQKSLLEK